MHISHHAVISLWLLNITTHFCSIFYYFIFFKLFFSLFCSFAHSHSMFFFSRSFHIVWRVFSMFVCVGVWMPHRNCLEPSIEYGVKMHKQIKLYKIFITSNCIEWSGDFSSYNLYSSVVLAHSLFFFAMCLWIDWLSQIERETFIHIWKDMRRQE